MYKYKRKIDDIKNIRKSSFILSDKGNICLNLNSDFSVTKPFNGMYIKNGRVIISNIFEKIKTRTESYKINNIGILNSNQNDEYVSLIDLENSTIEYDVDEFNFFKKIYLEEKTGILAIKYYIKNKTKYDLTFNAYPAITHRDLFNMKNSSMLRFNQRNEENGVVINLSISDNEDLILKSDKFNWNKECNFLNNISYILKEDNNSSNNFSEDLLVPGYFDIQVNPGESITSTIYITSKDLDIVDLSIEELSKKDFFLKEKISNSIENEYVELKELFYGMDKLKFENVIVPSIPYIRENELSIGKINITSNTLNNTLDVLIDITKAIEGEFLTFGKIKDATKRIIDIKKYIDYIERMDILEYESKYKFCLLKLWCIESINRVIQKQDIFNVFFEFVSKLIRSILKDPLKEQYFKNIEAISLMYNALKIYEDMLYKKGQEENQIFIIENELQKKIEKEFWNEDKRVMIKNLDEQEIYANVEMLYTISLSYPCIIGNIQFKLLDTVFKELYNPYGLREYAKSSDKNTGLIYPKYMAHFVKANLRQNGVTRASQKIAFNLVKELFLDINKYVNCGVKKVYSEKGYQIDTLTYDLLTNAEMVRLYDMLT